jgi:crotonobetainyl-CoA:carnitine CoA-transferase CaiB-like acyl-CoA transferase
MYGTADHRAIILAPAEKKFWHEFCDLVDLPELREVGSWAGGMDFGQGPEYESERIEIAGAIAQRPLNEWTEMFGRTSIPFAPVLTLGEALSSEHSAALGVMRPTMAGGEPVEIPATPIRISSKADAESGLGYITPAPTVGGHTSEILRELGLEVLIDEFQASPGAP